ncbi:MAG: ATP-binding protein [Rickettsiales bacterium]|nr:ATP-binding protein [Rickettsiales bacterium]
MNKEKVNPFNLTIVKFIITFSILIVIVNSVIVFYRAVYSYNKELKVAEENLIKLTRTISDHIELTFLAVDVVLRRASEKHRNNLLFGSNLSKDTINNIIYWVDETPQIAAMLIANEKGEISAIYRKQGFENWMRDKDYVSGLPFFNSHSDDVDALFIGKQDSADGNSGGFVVMSRSLSKLDGSFDGIVIAVVSANYITNFFDSIEKKRNTKIVLKHIDGREILTPQILDKKEERSAFDKAYFEAKNSVDLAQRVSLLRLQDANFSDVRVYTLFSIPSVLMQVSLIGYGNDIFRNWYDERISDIVFFFIFLLFVFVVAFFSIELARKVQRLRVSERDALAASKAKSDFLANMSHELRTPLNAIIGFSEMILNGYFGSVNSKQQERLKDILGCGNHLLSLINDVLEYSKGQAGKMEIRPEEFHINKVINESIRIFEERAKNEGISLVVDVENDMPYIFADRRKIKQILLNLISNSIKFSESGGMIEVSAKIDDKKQFVLAVKDTGIGMKEEDIPLALTAFGQVHIEKTTGGTGLGLPLCKLFAELHGGRIEIFSKEKQGTNVQIILPNKILLNNINEQKPNII